MLKINKSKLLYYYAKFVKEKGSPESVAGGWALGVLIGFAIPFGLQLFVSVPLSFVLRCSRIGAVAGTFVTNHVTILFIYPLQTWIGSYIIGNPINYSRVKDMIAKFTEDPSFEALSRLGGGIVASFFVGGFFLALAGAPVAYFAVKILVIKNRKRKELRKRRRMEKLLKEAEKSVESDL